MSYRDASLPVSERVATLVLLGLDDAQAVAALSTALGSPFEAMGAAHLPAAVSNGPGARTLIRIEGFGSSVEYRLGELRKLLRRYGAADVIEGEPAEALWRQIRDAIPLVEPHDKAVWRISTAPTEGPSFTALLSRSLDARWFYDWGGGLVWLACDAAGDAGAAAIRAALRSTGGHATLVRAPAEVRAAIDVFEPMSEPIQRLASGIKASFDPAGIFNPGRMHAGI